MNKDKKVIMAIQSITNNMGIGICYEDGSDFIWYRYTGGEKPSEWAEVPIEYDDEGNGFFKTNEGIAYFIGDFLLVPVNFTDVLSSIE